MKPVHFLYLSLGLVGILIFVVGAGYAAFRAASPEETLPQLQVRTGNPQKARDVARELTEREMLVASLQIDSDGNGIPNGIDNAVRADGPYMDHNAYLSAVAKVCAEYVADQLVTQEKCDEIIRNAERTQPE